MPLSIIASRHNHPSPSTSRQRPPRWLGWVTSILVFALLVICTQPPPSEHVVPTATSNSNKSLSSSPTPPKKVLAAGDVLVKCELVTPFDDGQSNERPAEGTLEITVHQGLAPLASNAFLDMVISHHFDHKYLFRVVKGFIVQWGIDSPNPNREEKQPAKTKFPKVGIDPPPATAEESSIRSNVRGSLNFAGGNTGTGQVYINRGKNAHLDKEPGSLPFATLDEQSMTIIDDVYSYKEGLGQVKAVRKGDEEVKKQFPRMSRIERCWIEDNSG